MKFTDNYLSSALNSFHKEMPLFGKDFLHNSNPSLGILKVLGALLHSYG